MQTDPQTNHNVSSNLVVANRSQGLPVDSTKLAGGRGPSASSEM